MIYRTSITKKPYIFVIFRGGGGPEPLPPPLDPPMSIESHPVIVICWSMVGLWLWRFLSFKMPFDDKSVQLKITSIFFNFKPKPIQLRVFSHLNWWVRK